MKKGRFLWSAHRITERQKAGKARSIKGKQLKNSRNTVSKQLVALLSSARDNCLSQDNSIRFTTPQDFGSGEFFSGSLSRVGVKLFWLQFGCWERYRV